MPVGTSIRIYDLAKDLKQDTKRVIEELRLEGADVSVPSHSVSKELAERLRNKYFPKAEAAPAPKRIIRVFPRKPTVESSANDFPLEESKVNLVKTQPQVEEKIPESSLTIIENKLKELPIEIPINSQKETSSNKLIDELKVDCRECLRPTKHNLIHSVEVKELEWNEKYQIVQCMGCESLSFRRITFKNNQSNDKEEIHLYPSRIKGRQKLQLESIPPTIALIYEEILVAINFSNQPYFGAVEISGNYDEITPNIGASLPPDDDKMKAKSQAKAALPTISLEAFGFRIFKKK